MHLFAIVAALSAFQVQTAKIEVPLKQITVGYFVKKRLPMILEGNAFKLEILKPSKEVPNDDRIYISFDYAKNALIFEGPKKDLEPLPAMIQLFDAKPRPLHFDIEIKDVRMGLDANVGLDCENTNQWTYANEDMGLVLTGSPRINADGTITIALKILREGKGTNLVARVKPDSKFGINAGEGKDCILTDASLGMKVMIKTTLPELASSKS